jgi:hypothetical protein
VVAEERPMRVLRLFGWILPPLVLAACDVTFLSISTDGFIEISVRTNGTALDTDGYRVRVDGVQTQAVAANGGITLSDISQGSHSVELTELAGNCVVEGENPRTVVVPSGKTLSLSFVVMCRPRGSIS